MIHNLLPYRMRNRALHYMSARVVLFGVLLMLVMIFDGLVLRAVDESFDYSHQILRAEVYEQVNTPDAVWLREKVARAERLVDGYRVYSPVLREISALLPEGVTVESLSLDAGGKNVLFSGHVVDIEIVERMEGLLEGSESVIESDVALRDLLPDGSAGFTATLSIEPRRL